MIRLVCKHIMRLSNTLRRHYKMLIWNLRYGRQFSAEKFHFRDGFQIYIEEEGVLKIGRGTFFNNNCSITARKMIRIGENCIFGENVKIYDHNHIFDNVENFIKRQGFVSSGVVIEDDCWIASNVIILKGVHIGKHSVIGAGVIVYKDVPANSLVICKQNTITKSI